MGASQAEPSFSSVLHRTSWMRASRENDLMQLKLQLEGQVTELREPSAGLERLWPWPGRSMQSWQAVQGGSWASGGKVLAAYLGSKSKPNKMKTVKGDVSALLMVLASKIQAEGVTSSSQLTVMGDLSQIGSETQFS